jgi:hypothetical protein
MNDTESGNPIKKRRGDGCIHEKRARSVWGQRGLGDFCRVGPAVAGFRSICSQVQTDLSLSFMRRLFLLESVSDQIVTKFWFPPNKTFGKHLQAQVEITSLGHASISSTDNLVVSSCSDQSSMLSKERK